jgi:predicted DNA-binding protein with PD1-like motif
MHSRTLGEGGGTESTHMVFFDPGEEAIEGLASFARENDIEVASFTAIGGFESASIGFFNLETRGFDEIPFDERQVEVLSLVGEITTEGDDPLVHGHVVLGRRDGSTLGGHLLRGVVRPILIVTVNEWSRELQPHHRHHHA